MTQIQQPPQIPPMENPAAMTLDRAVAEAPWRTIALAVAAGFVLGMATGGGHDSYDDFAPEGHPQLGYTSADFTHHVRAGQPVP